MYRTARRLKYLHLAYFSRPAHDRPIYRIIRRHQVRSIVEIGIGQALRAERMIRLAQAWCDASVRYTAIDLFELRSPADGPGLPLKQCYRRLKATGAKVQLAPGDPLAALARVANSLMGTDLVLVSADQDESTMDEAWFYVPRMLHPRSHVLVEERDELSGRWHVLSHGRIEQLARRQTRPHRLAA